MIELCGGTIPTNLEELVDPRHAAVVVVDVQNDFVAKGGQYQQIGRHLSKGDTVVTNLKVLLHEARKVGVPIVYIQNTNLQGHKSDSAVRIHSLMKVFRVDDPKLLPEYCLKGSWGQQIVEDIKPSYEDFVVEKNRSSAFFGTNLDILLRANNIRTLLITGIETQACVDSTARDAKLNDYFVVILGD